MEELFIRASEIEELLGVSKSMSYKLIHELNEELKAKGYKTLNLFLFAGIIQIMICAQEETRTFT